MIITLTGTNNFLRQTELEKLVADFLDKHGDMAIDRLDGEEVEYQKIYDSLTSLPFLTTKKLIVFKSPMANKAFVDNAEKLLSDLPDSTDVILVEPKFDKRLTVFKFLKAATDFREFNELDVNGLIRWLTEYVRQQEGSLGAADARFLVERVGTNQELLKNEIDKLLLYDPKIVHETIELLIEPLPQSTIFELLDAAFAGNTKKAQQLYVEQRALKVEPQQIIAMLAWQLHVLAIIKTAGERTTDQIASQAKINPFVVRKSSAIASKLTLVELKKLIQAALTLDIRLKSESIDPDEALQLFLLSLSS